MAEITAAMVKELREATNAGVLDCKKALSEANGDFEAAVEILRKKGLSTAAKKSGRETHEGIIGSYVHAGSKVASLVELACETDFVARTEQFQQLARDLAMQVVASRPRYVSREEIPAEEIEREKAIYREQLADSGKPAEIIEKIIEGKLEKWFAEVCLLEQPFVKDPDKTVQDLLVDNIAALGENIRVNRFARLEIGG
ncbi:translation elongation factor Ts [Litorilinea aerophila]|uniref:Elongation factor Ts n=1 Tax=Litorilinea aerophila TaxID=1204385 RepID=A0A540VEG5_9CHLR|nr:translation elongation factor Ts [Litorilinea aerophila]MCC9077103.1 translation elongation factor Ts [Litorilinea aerophila]OUC06131.1 elongation factor Ts [Litorilinea aerophila]GIV76153.1 MAG: elongation factor Ts [Litorilinea sp.]